MKKYILTFLALSTLWACQTDEQYERLNTDPKNPVEVSADFLFTSATVSLMDQMASPNVNLNVFRFLAQYLTSTTYLDEPNYNLNQRNIPQNHWRILYQDVIFDIQNAKQNVQAGLVDSPTELTQGEIDARLGQLEVIEIYAWHVLVDTFGDIPYSEAINAGEQNLPVYDDAASIYEDLISRLIAVESQLDAGQGFVAADQVYNGDMESWKRFSNSLLLRLGMRLADVNETLSQQTVATALERGVFTSNDQSAIVEYQTSPPNTNPLWEDLVQSGRSDYVAANTIVDVMNDLEDPRRDDYFAENQGPGTFIGGVYGGSNSFPEYTHVSQALREPTHPGILLDYAEVEFYQAEAAARGYSTPMSAEDHYNAAITASIEFWGGTEAEAQAYLSKPEVSYDSSNWEEQIGTQFWIAMYDNPFEGWSVWRKFDAPALNLPEDTENPVPLRYTYPVNEQNLNQQNYEAASSAIGGDDQQTSVFWDVD